MDAISCGNPPPPPSCITDRLWFHEDFPRQYNTKPQNRKNALVLFKETGGLGAISFANPPSPPTDPPWFHVCALPQYHKKNFKNLKQNALVLFKETRVLDQCRVAVPRPLHTLPTGSGVMKKFWRSTTTNFKIMYFLQQYHNKKHKQKHKQCVNFVWGDKCLEAISCGNPPPFVPYRQALV